MLSNKLANHWFRSLNVHQNALSAIDSLFTLQTPLTIIGRLEGRVFSIDYIIQFDGALQSYSRGVIADTSKREIQEQMWREHRT
jgi:hypothetical protein